MVTLCVPRRGVVLEKRIQFCETIRNSRQMAPGFEFFGRPVWISGRIGLLHGTKTHGCTPPHSSAQTADLFRKFHGNLGEPFGTGRPTFVITVSQTYHPRLCNIAHVPIFAFSGSRHSVWMTRWSTSTK